MQSAVLTSRLAPTDRVAVANLVARAESSRGYRPVSDQFWLDLHAPTPPLVSVRVFDLDDRLAAYAQSTLASDEWTIESVAASDGHVAGQALADAIEATLGVIAEIGGSSVTWLVQGPTVLHESIAASHSLAVGRQLHQMRRSLPVGLSFDIETRSFDPERDIDPWVAINGRAFAWNPEQGNWTANSVRARMSEPWFDPDGFLIHDRDGQMAGFCWTKVHADAEPVLGEIYVIAVDPDFHGLGLGRDLTLAGLDHLAGAGIATAMLFVDADNVAAIRVYDRLGFVIHRTDTLFTGNLSTVALSPEALSTDS
ncbi:MAG: mycothiol synthase [Ilumatobacteraceae bacterium]